MDMRLTASTPDCLDSLNESSLGAWHMRYQKSVAFHEAGHAVAFIAADIRSPAQRRSLLYVEASGVLGGRVGLDRDFMDYSDFLGIDDLPLKDIDHGSALAPLVLHAMEQEVLSYLAGPYAQVVYENGIQPCQPMDQLAREIEEAGDDFLSAGTIHNEMSRLGSNLSFSDLEHRALILLDTNWETIELLAGKLADACYLDGDEVYKIVQPFLKGAVADSLVT